MYWEMAIPYKVTFEHSYHTSNTYIQRRLGMPRSGFVFTNQEGDGGRVEIRI